MSDDDSDLVGALELIGTGPNGEETSFLVGVGRPRRQPTGEWACPTMSHDFEKPRPIYGEDSLQALCLSLSFIRLRLEDFLEKGGRLFLAEGRQEVFQRDIGVWFSRVGGSGAG